jgi:hypothetical protein
MRRAALVNSRPAAAAPPLRSVILFAIGVTGLAMCITLLYLGMRSVMDIGGQCADGGPYVIAQHCPDGAAAAMFIGMFGLFLFGGIAMWGGVSIGDPWAEVPLLAWTGLFGTLGWNFLDYGVFNAPSGQLEWGFAIPGVLFEIMAFGPVVLALWALVSSRPRPSAQVTAGIIRQVRPIRPNTLAIREPAPEPEAPEGPSLTDERRSMDQAFAAAVSAARSGAGRPAAPSESVVAGLERLSALRDRGALTADEFEAAKQALLHEEDGR